MVTINKYLEGIGFFEVLMGNSIFMIQAFISTINGHHRDHCPPVTVLNSGECVMMSGNSGEHDMMPRNSVERVMTSDNLRYCVMKSGS